MSRTNKTKLLLAQSLMELMETTPLERISVNDIVDQAGVGRNTFYYHFEDKFDLVNWYFQSGITQFLVEHGHYSNWPELLWDMESYFRENKVFYTNALAYTGQNCLMDYIFHFASDLFAQRMALSNPRASEREQRFAGDFLAGALMGILIPWLRGGMRGPGLSDTYDCLRTLCTGSIMQILGYDLSDEPPADR